MTPNIEKPQSLTAAWEALDRHELQLKGIRDDLDNALAKTTAERDMCRRTLEEIGFTPANRIVLKGVLESLNRGIPLNTVQRIRLESILSRLLGV